MAPPHPILNRAEDVLDDAAPDPHRIGHLVQTSLHGLDHRLMFPTGDAALLAGGAFGLHCAGATVAGPVSAECQPVLDSGEAPRSVVRLPGSGRCRFQTERRSLWLSEAVRRPSRLRSEAWGRLV